MSQCTCPSGNGSLRWPCPEHPPAAAVQPVGVTEEMAERASEAYLDVCPEGVNTRALRAAIAALANTPTQQAQGEAVGLRQAVADLAYELRMAGDKSVCEDDGQVMQDFGARLTALVGAST